MLRILFSRNQNSRVGIFLENRKVFSDLHGLSQRPFCPISTDVRQQSLSQEIGETTMNRMIRIPAIVFATAIAASNLTSPASAQAFSSSWGTGNVEETHYDAGGRLVRDAVSPNLTASQDRGLSAFASSPRKIHRK